MKSKTRDWYAPGFLVLFFIIFGVLSCVSSQAQRWYSVPSEQTLTLQNIKVGITPLKQGNPYYVSFRLSITNNSSKAVSIDWNQTRYLHKGNDLGVFVFRGIDPKSIKDAIPSDWIAAGETFTREIFPLRTISFLPRDQIPAKGGLGFLPGILPPGANGILLVLRQDDRMIRQTLTINLRAEPVSK